MVELTPSIRERLEVTRQEQQTYSPGDTVRREVGKRGLVLIVGPAAMGKNYIMSAVEAQSIDFRQAGGFTTRPEEARDRDNSRYRFIPHDNDHLTTLLDDIDEKRLLQYIVHPTTGYVYGTTPEDYGACYNLVDALSGSVDNFRTLGFRPVHTIGLVAPPAEWQARFLERYPHPSEERLRRIGEAITSLEFMQNDAQTRLVINESGRPESAAVSIIQAVTTDRYKAPSLAIVDDLYERARIIHDQDLAA